MATDDTLAARLERVRSAIHRAATAAGRSGDDVTLVGVTKTVDRPVIEEAVALGLTHLAENRVQAAAAKFAAPLPAGTTLHLVGQLQTNKARVAVGLFDTIESVDRPSLVAALDKEAQRLGRRLPVLLQVNVAREPQKSGCDPDAAASLAALIAGCPHLELRGLMTIAPLVADPEAVRPVFRRLRQLRDDLARGDASLDLRTLSMGMTNDFPVAIAEGATHVRVGRAIFGE
jgi:pyridoxal phosphate enzyme (YggS family)